MIPLKKSTILLDSVEQETAESNIRSRIAKKHGLSLTNTATWVIFPERLFVGKENKDGTVTVARYRNRMMKLFPKVYSTWHIEQHGNQVALKVKHRMSTFTIIGFWLFSIQHLVTGITKGWITTETLLLCASILALGIYLLFREIRTNERLLAKIAKERIGD